jgi:Flp pilus assembly protein protease CpaA
MNFDLLNLLFLFPLGIIGAICSYTDIKYGKIFNKWILRGGGYILFLYLFLFSYSFSVGNEENINSLLNLLVNGFTALLGGYILWHFKLWSAGDAKLFTVFSFLIPLSFYSKSYIAFFPSFNLLINLAVPLLFVLAGNKLFVLIKNVCNGKQKINQLLFLSKKNIFKSILSLFQTFSNYIFILIILRLLFFLIKSGPWSKFLLNPFLIFGLLLLIVSRFNAIRREKKWLNFIIYSAIISCGGFLVLSEQIDSLKNILKISLVFMIIMGSIRHFLNFRGLGQEIEWKKIKNMEDEMTLSEDSIYIIFKKIREKGMEKNFGKISDKGLNENQIKIIKNLFSPEEKIGILRPKTIPLGPFLFLSAIISILTKNSFLSFIVIFFHSLVE